MSSFVDAGKKALNEHLDGEPAMQRILAVQELLQGLCGDLGVTLPEARHLYRQAVMRSMGRDPDSQPGRAWSPSPDPQGPPEWTPMAHPPG